MKSLIERVKEARQLSDNMLNMKQLTSPMIYKDMPKIIHIVKDAIENNKKITFVGDYDVDGILSVFLGIAGLQSLGAKRIGYIIPNREKDGYGISDDIIRRLLESSCSVVITCDNGISYTDKLQVLREHGIKVIITDHHKVPKDIQEVDAILDLHSDRESVQFRDFCGAGICLQMLRALGVSKDFLIQAYPFAAIATICDSVPLLYDNRLIVKTGLSLMKYCRNRGLIGLILIAGIKDINNITVYDIGFKIGPRINAKGRLNDATDVVKLFLLKDYVVINKILKDIDEANRERQQLTNNGEEQVLELLPKAPEDKMIVVSKSGLHPGVIGIIASRIKDKFKLPTIVITNKGTVLTGSARSIEDVDIYDCIAKCSDSLVGFGGHKGAAGLSLYPENLRSFMLATQQFTFKKEDTKYDFEYDCENLTLGDVLALEELKPFGEGNRTPIFRSKAIIKSITIYDKVTKMTTIKNSDLTLFMKREEIELYLQQKGFSTDSADTSYVLDFMYTPQVNKFMGKESVDIVVKEVINMERS